MKKSNLLKLGALAILCGLSACTDLNTKKDSAGHDSSNEHHINVGISQDSLSLAGVVTSPSVKLTCFDYDSGPVTDLQFTLFGDQTDCKVKLLSFNLDGVAMTPLAGSDFDTYIADDLAIFEDALGVKDNITVKVDLQLPASLLGSANADVNYSFSQVVQGADQSIGNSVAVDAPAAIPDGWSPSGWLNLAGNMITAVQPLPLPWQEAIDSCVAMTLGGYTDWRLPSLDELLGPDLESGLYGDGIFTFNGGDIGNLNQYLWSSSAYSSSSTSAWRVSLNYGSTNNFTNKTDTYSFFCVR